MDDQELATILEHSPLFRGGRIVRPLGLHDYTGTGRVSFPLGVLDPHGAPCLVAIRNRSLPPLLAAYPGIRFVVSLDGKPAPVYEVRRRRWAGVAVLAGRKPTPTLDAAGKHASGRLGALLGFIAIGTAVVLVFLLVR